MLRQDKVAFGLGLHNLVSQRTVCKDDEKADVMTATLVTTGLNTRNFGIGVTVLLYLYR